MLSLEAKDLWAAPRGAPPESESVLRGLALGLAAGERAQVLGPNGSGKSTLALTLAGLNPFRRGVVLCQGKRPKGGAAGGVGIVFQNPENQFVTVSVERELLLGLELLGLGEEDAKRRIERTLERFSLTELRHRSPLRLSGGEKQRVALAAMTAMEPRVLLVDEATSYLDARGRRDVEDALDEVRGTVTLLRLSSTLRGMRGDESSRDVRLFLLEEGRLRETDWSRLLADEGTLGRLRLEKPPVLRLLKELASKGFGRFREDDKTRRPVDWAVEDLAGEISEFLIGKARVDSGGTCRGGEEGTRYNDVDHRARDEGGAAGGRTVLQAEDVWLTYGRSLPGEKTALRGVSLGLDRGELVGLLGDTGSGKSTLLAILGGLLRPDKGKVELEGESIFGRRRSGKLGVVFQFAEDQMVAETVLEDVAYGPRRQGREEAAGRRVAAEALEKVGVASTLFGRSLEALSFGERRLAALAGILAMDPDFLLLDEPTAGLDGMARIDLLRLLRELAREGRGILVATHDVELIAEVADRVVVLRDGEVWREGPVDILWRDCELSREVGLSHNHLLRLVKELERWGCSIAPKRMTPTSVAEALIGRSQG